MHVDHRLYGPKIVDAFAWHWLEMRFLTANVSADTIGVRQASAVVPSRGCAIRGNG